MTTLIDISVLPGSLILNPEQLKEIEDTVRDILTYDTSARLPAAALLSVLSECYQVGKAAAE